MTSKLAHTGIRGLDEALNGGLPRGGLYLVQGSPGAGKTTLALQFLLEGVHQGETALYITLSETAVELRAVAASHGWSLDSLVLFELQASTEDFTPEAQQTVFHAAEVELSEAMQPMLDEVARIDPALVVFDSLSEIRLLAQSALRYRRQILALKHFFAQRSCTVLLLDDLTSEPGDQQLASLAHGVISLEQLPMVYGGDRRRLRISKLRGVEYRSGYHDFTIERGGLQVYARLGLPHRGSLARSDLVKSNVRTLDALLGGGLTSGSSVLFMGPPGCGKSALAGQYVASVAARGEHAALFTFEESVETMLLRSDGLGMRLREHLESGKVSARHVNPAELSPGELFHRVRQVVEQGRAKLIVIDSLNGYLNAMPEEHFLLVQLHELFMYLESHDVLTIFTIAQHGLLGLQVAGPGDASYLADTVILLRYFEHEGRIRKAISVMKKRSGPHEDTIREFGLGAGGISVGAPLHQFRGVLTGVPEFLGAASSLLEHGDGHRSSRT